MKHCLHLFREGDTVLDMGCGSQDVKEFMPYGVEYIGLDKDPDCDPPPDILCNAGSVPLEDGCIDVIMALGFDVSRAPGCVSEIKRLLKPNGYFVFQGSREYFYLVNMRRVLRDSGFNIEEEFRQVLQYPDVSLRFVYYISRTR